MANRDFLTILGELDSGSIADDGLYQLSEVVRAVRKSGKKGSVTLKLEIAPDGQQVVISGKVDAKIPMPAKGQTIYFATDAGELTRDNPKQEPLRNLDRPGPRPVSNFDAPHKGA